MIFVLLVLSIELLIRTPSPVMIPIVELSPDEAAGGSLGTDGVGCFSSTRVGGWGAGSFVSGLEAEDSVLTFR
jgi:hypothetical protein